MKTETTTKQKFFKELSLIIDKFSNHGIKETTTISLVYQTAFKILEKQNCLKFPIQYIYNDIDFKKELWEKYANEITLVAFHLIYTIQEDEEFIDKFGNQEEDIDELNNWVHEKSKEYLTEYFEEINKELYSKEQLEEIKHLLGI